MNSFQFIVEKISGKVCISNNIVQSGLLKAYKIERKEIMKMRFSIYRFSTEYSLLKIFIKALKQILHAEQTLFYETYMNDRISDFFTKHQ